MARHSKQGPTCEVSGFWSHPTPPKTPRVLWTLRAVLIKPWTETRIATHHPQQPLSQSLPHSVLNVKWCRVWARQPASQRAWADPRLNRFLRINQMLLCLQTAADCTLCEYVRWAIVETQRGGGSHHMRDICSFHFESLQGAWANKTNIWCSPFPFN